MANSASGSDSSAVGSDDPPVREESESRITSVDAFSALLSNGDCRTALQCLCESEDPCSIEEFTDEVASLKYDVPAESISMVVRTTLATNLHYDHLPKLSAYGLLEYDSQHGRITDVSIDGELAAQLNGDR